MSSYISAGKWAGSIGLKTSHVVDFDVMYPPNENEEWVALWERSIPFEGTIFGFQLIEKWSNGHYALIEAGKFGALPTDNSGIPLRTCERRVAKHPSAKL